MASQSFFVSFEMLNMNNVFHTMLFASLMLLQQLGKSNAHQNNSQIFLLQATLPSNSELSTALQTEWKIALRDVSVTNNVLSFTIPSGKVEYKLIAQKMPQSDWLAFANIAWLWKSAKSELQGHTAYLDMTFIANSTVTTYQAELELAKVNSCVLHIMPNNAIGILNASSYLLIDRNLYRQTMKHLPPDEAPAYLMVYFGMSEEKNRFSGYTYGLHRFNLPEVEIVGSERSAHEVHAVLLQSVTNLLANGNLSVDASSKAAKSNVSISEGVFVQGQTMKIKF
jgi:hypothetical protein